MATESSTNEMSDLGKVELRREFGRTLAASNENFKNALSKCDLKRPEKTELSNAFADNQNRLRQMFNAKNKRKLNRPTGAKNQGILMPGYFHADIQNFFKTANMGPLRSYDYEFDETSGFKDADGKVHFVRCTDESGKVHLGVECSGRGRPLKMTKENTALLDSLVMLRDHGIASSTELATLFIVYARVNGLKDKGVYRSDPHMEKHLGRVFDFLESLPPVNGKRFSRKAFGQGEISKIPAFYALKNTENMPEAKLTEYGKKVGESASIFKKSHGLSDKQVKFLYGTDGLIKKEVVDRVALEFKTVQMANNCLGARAEPVRVPKPVATSGAQAEPKAAPVKASPKPKVVAASTVAAAVAGAVSSSSSSSGTVVEPKPAAKPRAAPKAAVTVSATKASPVAAKTAASAVKAAPKAVAVKAT